MTAINQESIELTFQGQTHRVDPTFEVIDRIEQRIGLAQVAQRLQQGDVRVSDLAWIVHAALTGSGHRMSYGECGNAILRSRQGIPEAADFVSRLVEAALSPGPDEPIDDEGEATGEGKAR